MSDAADDEDMPWSGRPQDDPALHAGLQRRCAAFRLEHPPVNCWIDTVQTIELYLDGARRALVDRGRALIMFYESDGAPAASVVYLRSENPYDVAEAHLGIPRVAEVRDESLEAEEMISAAPREQEDREAEEFRSRYYSDDEILRYLRSAISLLRHESVAATGAHSPIIEILLKAIGAGVLDQHAQALGLVQQAASALESRTADRFFGDPALVDCRRAIEAIERYIAVQAGRPIRRGPVGKSGG